MRRQPTTTTNPLQQFKLTRSHSVDMQNISCILLSHELTIFFSRTHVKYYCTEHNSDTKQELVQIFFKFKKKLYKRTEEKNGTIKILWLACGRKKLKNYFHLKSFYIFLCALLSKYELVHILCWMSLYCHY